MRKIKRQLVYAGIEAGGRTPVALGQPDAGGTKKWGGVIKAAAGAVDCCRAGLTAIKDARATARHSRPKPMKSRANWRARENLLAIHSNSSNAHATIGGATDAAAGLVVRDGMMASIAGGSTSPGFETSRKEPNVCAYTQVNSAPIKKICAE